MQDMRNLEPTDDELIETLIAVSVVAKRLAEKIQDKRKPPAAQMQRKAE